MERYTATSYQASRLITRTYSTSFGLSIRLFEPTLRPHIYAIYGLVRVADEVVDSYHGDYQRTLLGNLEAETKRAILSGYSTNPIVHAFAITARKFDIGSALITPFFDSMRMDITPKKFDQKLYETYIYGSAEVIGLMCLKVFTDNQNTYQALKSGAKQLGAAYQKINFLRDIATDAEKLGRWYFPKGSYDNFDEAAKLVIVQDIEKDLAAAAKVIVVLPISSRKAVCLSYQYYSELLKKIKQTSATDLKQTRIRVGDIQKTILFIRSSLGKYHD